MSTSNASSSSWAKEGWGKLGGCQCYCGISTYMKTSYTKQNFGHRLFSCPNYKLKHACGFFAWVDPPMCEHGKRVLRRMRERQERLNVESLNVDMLKGRSKNIAISRRSTSLH
ncbi:hypothetical protein CJ030_MR6G003931 [Morella rubra]|uniref:GRF-type domain-containing protein n=1 Tax=Morella rubra TaxID=262757 RepID=A0A6A1VBH5_9ROSI|nr:hypothetical protein CJ030_MR6G003931 [Morella rubra]